MTRKQQIKKWRSTFNKECMERDNETCRWCGRKATEVHHISPRNEMPNYGYVKENGISLCGDCHVLVERWFVEKEKLQVISPTVLYRIIGSSKKEAIIASENLKEEANNERPS